MFWVATVGVVVALIGVVSGWIQQDANAKKFGNRLLAVESSLRVLTQTVAPQIYQSINDSLSAAAVALNRTDAVKDLQTATAGINQLSVANVPPDANQLKRTGEILKRVTTANSQTPEAWTAAVQFVNYKYHSTPAGSLPNCIFQPTGTRSGMKVDNRWMVSFPYSNCTLSLDDEQYAKSILADQLDTFKTQHPNEPFSLVLLLNNVEVTYHGGMLIPVTRLEFTNTTFRFNVPGTVPEPSTQMLTAQLLTEGVSGGAVQVQSGM
jgi:hypothetical protein